ncbi:hypothetical protein [Pseudomonas lactis]|uniref:hypothetical protein n=1 Tax=Pseudomonas lactis TaxID=1615674 RepID=UPI003F80D626
MKTITIIYALTLLAFSSLSLADEPLESESVIAAKNRIEELGVSMINSQVELDKLKSDLAALRRAGDSEFFRIKLDKQETFVKDNFRALPMIENPEKLKDETNHKGQAPKYKPEEVSHLFGLLMIAAFGYLLLGLFIDKHVLTESKKQKENKESL